MVCEVIAEVVCDCIEVIAKVTCVHCSQTAQDSFIANPALPLLQAREASYHRFTIVDLIMNTSEDDYGRA